MRVCNTCQAELPEGAQFCPKCGKPVYYTNHKIYREDPATIEKWYRFTYKYVHDSITDVIKNETDVLTIIQDTYIDAFIHMDRVPNEYFFLNALLWTAQKKMLDWMKQGPLPSVARVEDGTDIPIETLEENTQGIHICDAYLNPRVREKQIRRIQKGIPNDEWMIVVMFYIKGCTVWEIAQTIGVSDGAIKSLIWHGRDEIRKNVGILQKKGAELWGMSPIQYLVWLLCDQNSHIYVSPDQRVLENIMIALRSFDR